MHTYIVHVHRARPGFIGPVSGILEDIESGRKVTFHSFDELQTLLGDSIAEGQLGFPDFTPLETDEYDKVVGIG